MFLIELALEAKFDRNGSKRSRNEQQTNKDRQMKKSSKLMVTLIITVALFNLNLGTAFAGVVSESESSVAPPVVAPSSLEFLSSEGALRAYAVETARGCRIGVGMNSAVYSTSQHSGGWDRPMNSLQMFRFVDGLFDKLWVKTVNTTDWVWTSGVILSPEGEELIRGWGGAYPVVGKGGSVDLPTFEMRYHLAPEIRVPFEGVESANMFLTNEEGRTVAHFVFEVRNGKFNFRTDMAGKGYLILRTKNGHTFAYDLRNMGVMAELSKINFGGNVVSVMDHMIPIVNPTEAYTHVEWSWDGVGVNPTFEIIIDTKPNGGSLDLSVSSTEGARPIAFMVRAQGNNRWEEIPVSNGRLYEKGPIQNGVYYIVPKWNPSEFRTRQPYIDDGGGRG